VSVPSRRDRTRPAELLGLSAALAAVTGFITFFGTRSLLISVEFAAVAFIVSLVVFAMLLLAVSPKRDDDDAGPPEGGHGL
jgi:membrane protein implicated in regulation of membrane protease activity